jgi:phosphotriesterase-related protein
MHEHVFVLTADSQQQWPGEWDEEPAVADAEHQGWPSWPPAACAPSSTRPVDGLGRDVQRIARITEQVDLNIVVATGVYTYTEVPHFFAHRGPAVLPEPAEPMVDLFVRDLTEGCQGTDVRRRSSSAPSTARGCSRGSSASCARSAKAHVQTGAPVMVHTHPAAGPGSRCGACSARRQVDPSRCCSPTAATRPTPTT